MFAVETKQYTKCKQYLDLSKFKKVKISTGDYHYRNSCSKCISKQQRDRRRGTLSNWIDNAYYDSKKRSKLKNLEHNLTKEWILANLPKSCPVLGIELSFTGDTQNSPSIDRFDNSKGYTTDNCRIISYRANMLKSNANIKELEAVIRYMKDKN